MTFDVVSLLVVSSGVLTLVTVLFLADVWARPTAPVDRIWSMSYIAILATELANLVLALGPGVRWVSAAANATTIFAVWSMWSGARAYSHRDSLLWVSGVVTAVVFVAAVLDGRAQAQWAGIAVHIGALAAGAALAGSEVLTGPLRRTHPGRVLAVLAYLLALYYIVRLALLVLYGPESPEFTAVAGTAVTTVVLTVLAVGAAFSMVSLRAADVGRGERLALNFDPLTGARTLPTFRVRAERVLRDAGREARQACLVVVRPESVDAIAIAFGPQYADRALAVCGEAAAALTPRTLLGLDASGKTGFEVLLPDTRLAEGLDWATRLRKELIDSPIDVPGSRVRLTVSLGVACVAQVGYDLDRLRTAAAAAAARATAEGGNRVIAADGVRA